MAGVDTTAGVAEELRGRTAGDVLVPGDDGYEEARAVWNGMVDRRPALIVRCTTTPDVVAAGRTARTRDLPLSVRAGGHNVAGRAIVEDGVVVDLSQMRAVRIDPVARHAWVQAGATWADFDAAAQDHGLATTGGVHSGTGVAGLTLGGGFGYLARRYGLACDNLVGADVVTADGEVVHASEESHPELFWALRGGGGNLGVVTSFEFELHPVGPEVLVAQAFHRYEDAGAVLRAYRDLLAAAPDTVSAYALVIHLPPVAPFPADLHGQPAVALVAVHTGEVEAGRPLLDPVAAIGDPVVSFVAPMAYAELQSSFDAGSPDGARYHYRSQFLAGLPDEAIDVLVAGAANLPGAFTMVGIEPMGGAIARVPADATAFPHRDAAFDLGIWGGWTDPADDERIAAWARDLHDAMRPFGTGGVYVNYLDDDEDARVPDAYGPVWDRLAAAKAAWDPDNLFRATMNVPPSGRSSTG